MKTQSRQHFEISREGYWRELCLNLEYQKRLYTEALGCNDMEVVKNEGDYEGGMKRNLRFIKKSDAPAAVRKVFGEETTLTEISEFDAERQCWKFQMVPSVMADRLEIRGEIRLEEKPDGTVDQVSEQTFNCKIFGIGGIVERFIAKSIQESQADKTRFTQKYIQDNALR